VGEPVRPLHRTVLKLQHARRVKLLYGEAAA
jgi:hypothetical protein